MPLIVRTCLAIPSNSLLLFARIVRWAWGCCRSARETYQQAIPYSVFLTVNCGLYCFRSDRLIWLLPSCVMLA